MMEKIVDRLGSWIFYPLDVLGECPYPLLRVFLLLPAAMLGIFLMLILGIPAMLCGILGAFEDAYTGKL
jgi:hypothetical protein